MALITAFKNIILRRVHRFTRLAQKWLGSSLQVNKESARARGRAGQKGSSRSHLGRNTSAEPGQDLGLQSRVWI